MAKVAIPVTGNLLSENLGDCSYYAIYEIDNKDIVGKTREVLPKKAIGAFSKWAEESGISDVIVHGIDKSYVSYFSDTKINLFVGVNISEPKTLIEEYLNGTLQSNVKNISEQ